MFVDRWFLPPPLFFVSDLVDGLSVSLCVRVQLVFEGRWLNDDKARLGEIGRDLGGVGRLPKWQVTCMRRPDVLQTMVEPTAWTPNRAVRGCQVCAAPFSAVRRRHHCRQCGKVVCKSCSAHARLMKPSPGPSTSRSRRRDSRNSGGSNSNDPPAKPQRVCDACVRSEKAAAAAAEPPASRERERAKGKGSSSSSPRAREEALSPNRIQKEGDREAKGRTTSESLSGGSGSGSGNGSDSGGPQRPPHLRVQSKKHVRHGGVNAVHGVKSPAESEVSTAGEEEQKQDQQHPVGVTLGFKELVAKCIAKEGTQYLSVRNAVVSEVGRAVRADEKHYIRQQLKFAFEHF